MDCGHRFNFELTTMAAHHRGPNKNRGREHHPPPPPPSSSRVSCFILCVEGATLARSSSLSRTLDALDCADDSGAILEFEPDSTGSLVHCQSSVLRGSDTRDHVIPTRHGSPIRNIHQRLPRISIKAAFTVRLRTGYNISCKINDSRSRTTLLSLVQVYRFPGCESCRRN